MRVVIPVVIDMTDAQVQDYADEYGLPLSNGGKPYAREVVADVRAYVLNSLQQCPAFYEGRADISIRER
jgi:hypothetical protein